MPRLPGLNRDYERRPYWHAGMPSLPDRSGKDLPDTADAVVIGGGYTGTAAARKLALQGVRTVLLEAVDAGLLPLARMIEALTTGPASVLPAAPRPGLVLGAPADLVVFDRAERWTVEARSLRTKGFGHPLAGRSLPGVVLLTVAGGRLAHEAS